MAINVDLALLEVLVAARRSARATLFERSRLFRSMRAQVRKLRKWAASCPENFESHWLLAEAEAARARGAHAEALARQVGALKAARDHQSPKRVALALELTARLLAELGRTDDATAHHRQAVDAYRAWGAEAKAAALEGFPPSS